MVEGMDGIHVAFNTAQWQVLVNTVTLVSVKGGEY
jgi:hypothetical protein